MNILGIHDGQNAAAALVQNGELAGFKYEANHRREGEYAGFPRRAIATLLAEHELTVKDIDAIAFAGHVMKQQRTQRDYLKQFANEPGIGEVAKTALSYVIPGAFRTELRKRDRLSRLNRVSLPLGKATFVDAHLAASMLAYASGPGLSRRCLVLCAGRGADRLAATVHVAQNGKLERIATVHEDDSLGNLLEHVTYLLGMAPQRDEQLVMDLGAQARGSAVEGAAKRFSLLFEFDEMIPLSWHRAGPLPDTAHCQDFLRRHFRRRRFDQIAGGWFRFLSRFAAEWIGRCAHKTEIRDIVLCGDLFELGELIPVASRHRDVIGLTRSPLPGEAGNAIGAALLVAIEREEEGYRAIKPISGPYFGRSLSATVCAEAVETLREDPELVIEQPSDMPFRAAELLAAGAVLARLAGPDDLRQQGLGNCNLMARADHPPAREKLREIYASETFWANQAIFWQSERLRNNFREADTLPEAACGQFYLTPRNASPWYGLHEGRKVPVQAVSRALNHDFWELLDAFHGLLGRTPMLSTPWLNEKGQLVKTAKDAASLWRKQGLSGLILGPWLVYRTDLSVTSERSGAQESVESRMQG